MSEELLFDITAYILIRRRKGKKFYKAEDAFKEWVAEKDVVINNIDDELWCIHYIEELMELPMRDLELAYMLDEEKLAVQA